MSRYGEFSDKRVKVWSCLVRAAALRAVVGSVASIAELPQCVNAGQVDGHERDLSRGSPARTSRASVEGLSSATRHRLRPHPPASGRPHSIDDQALVGDTKVC